MIASRRDFLSGASALGAACATDFRTFSAADNEPSLVLPLWPGAAPGGPAPAIEDRIDDQIDTLGFRYRVATSVATPTLSWFAPTSPTGAAALLIPGGGYSRVGIDREGYEGARWLASLGVSAFVLRYRLPAQGWPGRGDAPLQDAQRAIRLIRAGGAGRWLVDPRRISVLGFSAGGHLAARLATRAGVRLYELNGPEERLSARPDGAVLVYPVINLRDPTHRGTRTALVGQSPSDRDVAMFSADVDVPSTTPPILLLHSLRDRTVPVDQSLAMFTAVRAAAGPVDLHIFNDGDHGVGLRANPSQPFAAWPSLVEHWARQNSLI